MKTSRAFGLATLVAAGSAFVAFNPGSLALAAGLAQPVEPIAPAPAPVATPSDPAAPAAMAVPCFVRAVQGKVQVRDKPGAPLRKVEVGMVLGEGAELFTLAKSAVQIQIGAGQIFTVDFNTRVILREVINKSGTEKTSIDMPYGRITFDVTSTQVANDVTITAPDATLAVKGTSGGLQSRPGFGPLAFGGVLNKGLFDVKYDNRIVASITGSESSSGDSPDPASFERTSQFVDSAAGSSRETSEVEAIQTQGFSSPIINTTPAPRTVNADNDIIKPDGTLFGETFLDLGTNGSTLVGRDLFFNTRRVRTPISGVQGVVQGATILVNTSGQRTLLIVDNVASGNGNTPTFRTLNLDNPNAFSYTTIGSVPPVAGGFGGFTTFTFFGLGAIENRLFAGGVDSNFSHGIFELDLGNLNNLSPVGSVGVNLVTGLDAQLQPAMAAAPGRGTVFVIGTPNNTGGGGPSTPNWVLYEVNPISGSVVNTRSTNGANGDDFANQPTTTGSTNLSFNDVQVISGMAYVNGTLVMSGFTNTGRAVTIYYNPDATNAAGDPTVRVIDGSVTGFGSTTLATSTQLLSNNAGRNSTPEFAQIAALATRSLAQAQVESSDVLDIKPEKQPLGASNSRALRKGEFKGQFENKNIKAIKDSAPARPTTPPLARERVRERVAEVRDMN
jgi:hypothetical protein